MGNAGVVTSRSIVGGRLAPVNPFRQTATFGAVMSASGVVLSGGRVCDLIGGHGASAGVWRTGESPVGGQSEGKRDFCVGKRAFRSKVPSSHQCLNPVPRPTRGLSTRRCAMQASQKQMEEGKKNLQVTNYLMHGSGSCCR